MNPIPGEAPSISITAGISGSSRRRMSQETWQMEKVLTRPVSPTSAQASVGRKHSSQNILGGTSIRRHLRHSRARILPSFSPWRYRLTAMPVSQAYRASTAKSTAPTLSRNWASVRDVPGVTNGGDPEGSGLLRTVIGPSPRPSRPA